MKDLIDQLNGLIADFQKNSAACAHGNKAAGMRARKASLTLEKLLKEFRKVSIEAAKA